MNDNVDNVNHMVAKPGEDIAEEIHAIRHLFNQRRYQAQNIGGHELSHMEARVIFFVGGHPGATQKEIVAQFGRDKAQIARLIAILRQNGLIELQTDSTDKRMQRMFLTGKGRSMHDQTKGERKRLAALAVADFDPAEHKVLMNLLGRVRANLEIG